MRKNSITFRMGFAGIAIYVATSSALGQRSDHAESSPRFGVIEVAVGTPLVVQHSVKANVERAFIPVETPNLGDTLIIDLAELVFSATTECDSAQPLLIALYPSIIPPSSRSGSWQEEWTDNSGGFDAEFVTILPVHSTESDTEIRVDVTEIVRRWALDEAPNYGFVLKSHAEDKSTFKWIRDGRYRGQDAKLEIYYSRNPLASK